MNEENNLFSIDVSAETQSISSGFNDETVVPSETVTVLNDSSLNTDLQKLGVSPSNSDDLIKSITIEYSETEKLIKSIPVEATEISTKMNVAPQESKTSGINFSVKIDPETVYKKTEQLENNLKTLQSGVETMANEMNNSWLPNKNTDDFEERPIVEATNLIFENRRDQMSQNPFWA